MTTAADKRPSSLKIPSALDLIVRPDPQVRLRELTDRLHARGQRVTPQRLAVLSALLESDRHLVADEIHRQILVRYPGMSLSAVYSVLNLLVEMGEVLEIPVFNRRYYEALQPIAHPHLICTECHTVHDADVSASSVCEIGAKASAEATGYSFVQLQITVLGVCPDCRERQVDSAKASSSLASAERSLVDTSE